MRYPYRKYSNYYYPCPMKISNEKETFNYFNLDDPAPNFTLDGVLNGERIRTSLSDYLGKWVVLFFYGSDFTFV